MKGETLRMEGKRRLGRKALSLIASAAILSACAGGEPNVVDSASAGVPNVATASPDASRAAGPFVKFTFDNLGSTYPGAETVFAYPGPLDTPTDRQHNATYNNGDVMSALCIARGRRLVPDPKYQESPRPLEVQDEWVKVVDTPTVDQYASLTYGRLVPADAQLPECTDVS